MQKQLSSSAKVFYPPFSREEVVHRLKSKVADLRQVLPVTCIVLFGSYARGRHTVASDIDVLVIYVGEPREDAYAVVKKTLALRGLEPHVYADAEARAMRDTIARMTRDGVVIYGSEAATETAEPVSDLAPQR